MKFKLMKSVGSMHGKKVPSRQEKVWHSMTSMALSVKVLSSIIFLINLYTFVMRISSIGILYMYLCRENVSC